MARRADDFDDDVVVPGDGSDDTSLEALHAWVAAIERDYDSIDLPVTAADLIAEDRAALPS
jgi:hypothetical protein